MTSGHPTFTCAALPAALREALAEALRSSAAEPRTPTALFGLARRVNLHWHLGRGLPGLTHELRGPLSVLMSNLELLTTEASQSGDHRPSFDADQCREMTGASESIEGYLRAVTDAADVDPVAATVLDLDECVRAALLVAHNALKYRVEVRFEAGAAPHVLARPHVVSQTLLNVLLNAANATTRWGPLTVRTFADGGRGAVEVSDTGCGFSAEDLAASPTPLRCGWPDADGLGIGLFIADVLARGEGGSLRRANRAEGGAVVTLFLPDGIGASRNAKGE